MRKSLVFLPLFPLVLTLACAGMQPLTEADIDPGTYPDNYQDIILQHLRQTLIDPTSLIDFSIDAPPVRTVLTMGFPAFGLRKGMGVYECKFVWYNAKNRMGGYTGRKAHIFLIRHGQVVAAF